MARKRNEGMIGGAEVDPLMKEYEERAAGVFEEQTEERMGAVNERIAAPFLLESGRLVKIPMDWGKKFWIAYEGGAVVEYGVGCNNKPPDGKKPLWYLIEPVAEAVREGADG